MHQILTDYQDRADGGEGWLRYYVFDPSEDSIEAVTYSPTLDRYETDANSSFTLSYDMGESTSTEQVLVRGGSTWWWQCVNTAWPAGWTGLGFDDSAWNTGPPVLGFGTTGLGTNIDVPAPTANRPRSAWFRQQFTITDASALSQVAVTTRADDGVVVYVNGIEIGRKKLPTGTLASTSYATAAPRTSIATATANAVTFPVPTTALRDGPNVITASTHLNYRSTADLSFDLVMTGMLDGDPPPPDEPPTAPVVTASTTGDTATLGLTHAAGVAGYRISRDGAELSTVPAPGTTFTDSGLAPSTTYRYSVIVVGTTGLTSPAGTASITTAATPPPPPPGPTTLFQTGSTWRWQYVNTAWPAGWTGLGFDDFTWNTGPAVLGLRQRRPPHQRRNGQRRNLHRPHHSIARQNQRRHRINPPQRPRHHRHQLRPCHDRHTEGIGIRRVGRGAPRPGLLGARWTGAAEAAVPVVGLEPTRPLEQSILSAPRLPFRHTGAQQPRSEYRRV